MAKRGRKPLERQKKQYTCRLTVDAFEPMKKLCDMAGISLWKKLDAILCDYARIAEVKHGYTGQDLTSEEAHELIGSLLRGTYKSKV